MADSSWVNDLMAWIGEHRAWSGPIVFFIALIESLILVGILIPGILILLGFGALIALGVLDFYTIWIAASCGAFAGDLISYLLGHKYRERLADMWPFRSFPKGLQGAREFISEHGNKSIVLGRFIGPLRPVVPAVAGMLGMQPRQFLKVDVPACIAWSPVYLLPGMLFGASLEVASEYAGRFAVVLILLVVIIGLLVWLFRLLYEVFVRTSARWLRKLIRWARRHPLIGRAIRDLVDPTHPEALSLTMLGLSLLVTIVLLLIVFLLLPWGDSPLGFDQQIAYLAASLRSEMVDPLMISLYQLGRWQVWLFTAGITLGWLLYQGRHKAAIHWVLAVAGGSVLQLLLSTILTATPLVTGLSSGVSAPSGDLVLATTTLGFFAVMEAADLKRIHRRWPYILASLAILLLAASRLYLGQDQLSTLMLGFLLGGSWTAIVGLAYRTRIRRRFKPQLAGVVFFGSLIIAVWFAAGKQLEADHGLYDLSLPNISSTSTNWWQQDWQLLDKQRAVFGSHPARYFNFQYAGDIERLANALQQTGWQSSNPAGWLWPLETLNPQPDYNSLPIPGRDYLGHKENLRLLLPGAILGETRVVTLRLWDSGMSLEDTGDRVYLGQLITESLYAALELFHYWRAQDLSTQELELLLKNMSTTGLNHQQRDDVLLLRFISADN